MKLTYRLFIGFIRFVLPILAFFSKKVKLFVEGRKLTFEKLKPLQGTEVIWFHVASLGEFEQARPIIEEVKELVPSYKILVTFFSPSGYEVRKDYHMADVVCYLPLDSKSNAVQFVKWVNPKLAIFVKYEFWPNLLFELKRNNSKTILVSGIFRENQIFFEWYGKLMRNALKSFDHFFVQNSESKELLKSLAFGNVTISGDTRFDRVYKILQQKKKLDFVDQFKSDQLTIVAGSTWKEDEALLIDYINTSDNCKFIIAPHTISKKSISDLKAMLSKRVILYSEREGRQLENYDVLIIDTIGILTNIYAYADAAYVGGGLKTGLHNILEPATFGIPVVIGHKYDKFKEAIDLVELKGCFSIKNQKEFDTIFDKLIQEETFRRSSGKIAGDYIQENYGATDKIIAYIKTMLN